MKLLRTIEIATDNGYMVGDTIAFTLTNGEEVEAMAVKQEQDGMVFCLVDCLNLACYMNLEDSNRGGYAASYMRKNLNGEILTRFPPDIREKMIAFASGDYLRLPTEKEIFGCNECGKAEPGNVVQWEPMKQQRNRIAFWGKGTNQWVRYWLQNAYTWKCLGKRYNSYFVNVDVHGCVDYMGVSELSGVRPVFKLANPSLSVRNVNDRKAAITKDTFIAVSEEQIGITVDVVFYKDEYHGWEDFQLVYLDEKPSQAAWNKAMAYAESLRKELGIMRPLQVNKELKENG